jgi:hypothetical protein
MGRDLTKALCFLHSAQAAAIPAESLILPLASGSKSIEPGPHKTSSPQGPGARNDGNRYFAMTTAPPV